ncbi:MAG: hypothetical protein ABIM30_02420 [candidate division WOR-3 bacterium]
MLAVIVRLIVTLAIEAVPPEHTPGAVRLSSGLIWKDEAYYLENAYLFGQTADTLTKMDVLNPYERVAGFYALWILLLGDAMVWGRLINVFLGALTVVVLYDTLVRFIQKKSQYIAFWFLVSSPVLLHFSIVYLKENLLILGLSLIINGIVKLNDRYSLLSQMFKLGAGFAICMWVRNSSLFLLLLPLVLAIVTSKKTGKSGQSLSVPTFVLILVLFAALIGSVAAQPEKVIEMFGDLVYLQGAELLFQSAVALESGKVSINFPFFESVMELSGLSRGLGLTFLLLLSPTITSVYHLLPVLGNPDWYVFAVSAHAVSWWICLPFVMYAIFGAIRTKDIWWLCWSVCLVLWIIFCANARYGAGYDAFRYRDSYVPVIMLLAAKGLNSTLYPVSAREAQVWKYILRAYTVFVITLILLAGIGVIGR